MLNSVIRFSLRHRLVDGVLRLLDFNAVSGLKRHIGYDHEAADEILDQILQTQAYRQSGRSKDGKKRVTRWRENINDEQ